MTWLMITLWIANVAFDTIGQISFKYAATVQEEGQSIFDYWKGLLKNIWLWIGILSYILEFFLWLAFLTLVPLSQGVLLASLNIITIMLAGRLLFNEKLIPLRIIGIVFVLAGVIVVGAF
ncbi:EamA family transporter [Wohlfahrtiimonas larvae]|uniref:EamA domain-containing protein n=1 Tax=Wohlfahrtiimonas larvae TaxID=1157986 RepID=A0ABP9MXR5_9GAMM|nr:EamA family transporter [Wohlfahrtiimonas larvae]